MSAADHPSPSPDRNWDRLTEQLQELRTAAGEPSFGDIALRIGAAREARGLSEHASRVARSTVYDCFRTGRSRINLTLVREIGLVLGASKTQIDDWIKASREDPQPDPRHAEEAVPVLVRTRSTVLLMAACLALNLVGREFVDFFRLPIYLDMTGTAIVAIALGPWRGAAVGAATNVLGIIGSGWISLPFALVNVVGALVWGYGVRAWGMGRSLPRFFLLNIAVAVSCTLVAVPIIVATLGGDLRVGHDLVTQLVDRSIDTFIVALGFSNALTSLVDKLISGFVAITVIAALPVPLRRHAPLRFIAVAPQESQ